MYIKRKRGYRDMALKELEARLSKLDEKISELLKERESVLREWSNVFGAENPQNIVCIDENVGETHTLYLVNGESRMLVCRINDFDIKGNINDFYKVIDNSMHIINIANGRDFEIKDYQKNLVYAKAAEIRDNIK